MPKIATALAAAYSVENILINTRLQPGERPVPREKPFETVFLLVGSPATALKTRC
jgi:hypothetical protein